MTRSMLTFCSGSPGPIQCHSTLLSLAHVRMALPVNSVPLSVQAGFP
jgi:hypothetical protein